MIDMTKEEKIKEAYGRFYKPEKYHFSVNGWVDLNEWSENEVGKLIDEIDMEFREYSARPKSLQGIENNNGWIRIESEEDFPKESGYYLLILKNIGVKIDFWKHYESKFELWNKDSITHYQPIEKPLKPLY